MSVYVTSRVWGLQLSPVEKLVMLKLADCANDQGRNAYPAVQTIADAVGVNARTVQRALRELEGRGLIEVEHRAAAGRPNCYRLHPERGDKLSPRQNVTPDTGVTPGVTSTTERGDTAMSPEPSLTVIEPSFPPGDARAAQPGGQPLLLTEPVPITRKPTRAKSLANPRRPFTAEAKEALREELGHRVPDFEASVRKAMNSPGYQFGADKLGHVRDWLLRDIASAERGAGNRGTTRRNPEQGDDELAAFLERNRAVPR